MTARNKTLRNYHIVARRVPSQSCTVIANYVNVVKKLTFCRSEYKNVVWLDNLGSSLLLLNSVVLHHSLWGDKDSQTFTWSLMVLLMLVPLTVVGWGADSSLVSVRAWRIRPLSLGTLNLWNGLLHLSVQSLVNLGWLAMLLHDLLCGLRNLSLVIG
jgi:hypothetical protein